MTWARWGWPLVVWVGSSVGLDSQHVDKDTPASEHHRRDKFGRDLELVMSDEFSEDGRLFGDGQDPIWTATHNADKTNRARARRSRRLDVVATSARGAPLRAARARPPSLSPRPTRAPRAARLQRASPTCGPRW
jgi:hypothetical protein